MILAKIIIVQKTSFSLKTNVQFIFLSISRYGFEELSPKLKDLRYSVVLYEPRSEP